MKKTSQIQLAIAALMLSSAIFADTTLTAPTTDFTRAERYEKFPGGQTTHRKRLNKNAFSHASANMKFEREIDFKVGNGFFKRLWVTAPASTQAADGLGPLYNARACQRCHLKDGRGHPPRGNKDNAVSMFLRISIPPQNDEQRRQLMERKISVVPEPMYGTQLQDFAIPSIESEGRMHIEYDELPITFADGERITLRKPHYSVKDLAYGPLHPQTMLSPRVAPQMIGLGLLEAVPEQDILAHADPEDRNGDGVSGKSNRVWSAEHQKVMLGRFGWKAGHVSVNEQSQGAFTGDMGLSVPLHTSGAGECTKLQTKCQQAPNGNSPQYENLEIGKKVTELVVFYSRNLAVPVRRNHDAPDVLAGKKLFYEIGCIQCHRPKFVTRKDSIGIEQSSQLIWPYTDLLLHDMGEGLADNRPEGVANGREWRTPPLWGIGLTPVVNGHNYYLHDGRARGVLEAIMWHGGEAERHREAVRHLPKNGRDQLVTFVESL